MFTTLGPGAIGLKSLTLPESIALAKEAGFASVTVEIREAASLAEAHGVDHVRGLFADAGIRPALFGAPVGYRDDARYAAGLETLAGFAALARQLGCTRATTGVAPGSDDLAFDANLAWHADRLRPVAQILADEGCQLGIEFIGPKTSRAHFRHEFVYTLDGTLELAKAIGTGNVGVLLDAWHLYTSGGEVEDMNGLPAEAVVAVHVNDAPPGIPIDEQIDTIRTLPLETGVMDLAGFMGALQRIGYDGPVMPEPFSQRIEELAGRDPMAAARETARSMDDLWRVSGLG